MSISVSVIPSPPTPNPHQELGPAVKWIRWSPVEYSCSNFTAPEYAHCDGTNPTDPSCYSCNGEAPDDATDDQMDAFVAEYVLPDGGLAKLKTTYDRIRGLGITPMGVFWSAPFDYLDPDLSSYFGMPIGREESIPDMATYFASCLATLVNAGIEVPYVELLNEVDGYWKGVTHLAPYEYAYLVGNTTAALKRRGLWKETTIVGPAVSQIKTNPIAYPPSNFADYVAALQVKQGPEQKVPSWDEIGAVSAHSYDWLVAMENGEQHNITFQEDALTTFMATVDAADPMHDKLRIISEFSNENYIQPDEEKSNGATKTWKHSPFMGTCYPDATTDVMYSDSQAYDPQFIVRNTALLLMHINTEADVGIFWELADKRSDNKVGYGVCVWGGGRGDLDGQRKRVGEAQAEGKGGRLAR